LRKFGVKSASSAHTAIEAMLQRQILVREKPASIVFDNPFFKRWVVANGVPANGAHILPETSKSKALGSRPAKIQLI
jgi:hypothetical protein